MELIEPDDHVNKGQSTNDVMPKYAERSVGVAALYNEERGFMGAAELAKKAIDTGKSVKGVVAEE